MYVHITARDDKMIAQFVACFDTRSGSEFLANQNAEHNAQKIKKIKKKHYENPRNSESAISEPRSGEGSLYSKKKSKYLQMSTMEDIF